MNSVNAKQRYSCYAETEIMPLTLGIQRDDPPLDPDVQQLLERVESGELLYPALSASSNWHDDEETPVEGAGAIKRWIALHTRAHDLRANLLPGDIVRARQVKRAVHSLFLYEHQLTPRTRRRARILLWQRTSQRMLPPLRVQAEWGKCRCSTCQPAQWVPAVASTSTLLRTA